MKIIPSLLWLTMSAVPYFSHAEALPNAPHIKTSGQAELNIKPDMAIVTLTARVTHKNASEAKKEIDQKIAHYFDVLHEKGINAQDIQAANLRTQPSYEYDVESKKSVLVGYTAIRTLTVTVYALDRLNTILDEALAKSFTEIKSIQFSVRFPENYRQTVRESAIQNAIEQAQALAHGFHVQLGSIYSIHYSPPQASHSQMIGLQYDLQKRSATQMSETDITYEQPNISFTDRVDVVFEILPSQ